MVQVRCCDTALRGRRIRSASQQHPLYVLYQVSRQYAYRHVSHAFLHEAKNKGLARGESEAQGCRRQILQGGTQREQGREEGTSRCDEADIVGIVLPNNWALGIGDMQLVHVPAQSQPRRLKNR